MFGLFHKMQSSAGALTARLAPRRFMRSEEGTITAFAIMLFVLMVGASGIAIDVMRYETQRTQLQNTLDRAVLAAASLTQPYDPEGVVRDYFSIAGINDYRLDVRVDEGINFRRVHAYAELDVRSYFMHMFGVRVMTTPAIGAAEERVQEVEISLVLDFSASMRSISDDGQSRIARLRTATDGFLERVFEDGREGETSINFVPYAGTVNPGATVFNLLGGQRNTLTYQDTSGNPLVADGDQIETDIYGNTYTFADGDPLVDADGDPLVRYRDPLSNSCLEYTTTDFASNFVPAPGTYAQVPHWQHWTYTGAEREWGWCPNSRVGVSGEPLQEIAYLSDSASGVQGLLDQTHLYDGTGTDIGMMWGLWLLDPGSNWFIRDLVDEGMVPEQFEDRPAPYDDPETVKIIVLMTDGDITAQFRPRYPDRTLDPLAATDMDDVWLNNTVNVLGMSNAQCNGIRTCHLTPQGVATSRTQFQSLCQRARANGITIFTIAFDTNDSAAEEMRSCAGVDANFYNVQGSELNDAFLSIAGAVQALRLIQ